MEAQYVVRDHIYPNFIYSIFKKSVNESIFWETSPFSVAFWKGVWDRTQSVFE